MGVTKARILVVGSANMDAVTSIERLPILGETLRAGEVLWVPGGKGANAAIAAARMGAEVQFAGCVGADSFGTALRDNLVANGINTKHLRTTEGQSGIAVILLERGSGQNAILVSPGANALVEAPSDPGWYSGAGVLLLQLETPVAAAIDAAHKARRSGVTVILDPAPAIPAPPQELLKQVDILLPNETELASLSNRKVASTGEAVEAARGLQSNTGIRHVIVTLGERGVLNVTNEQYKHYPTLPVAAVDTTAAGDAFAGAIAARIAEGKSIDSAIQFAIIAGALTCTKVGAQTSIPTRNQVLKYLDPPVEAEACSVDTR